MENFIKKTIKIGFFALLAFVIFNFDVLAREILPIESSEYVRGGLPAPPTQSGQKIAVDLVMAGLGYVKVLAVVVGILYLTLQGFRLVYSSGNEEEVGNAKKAVIYILIAFVLISMSQDLAKIFDMSGGSILGTPAEILKRVHIFDKQVEIVITFIKYMAGAYAVLMIVLSALNMITKGGVEEERTKAKKNIYFSIGGLLIILLGDMVVNQVFYRVDKQVYSGLSGVQPYVDVSAGVGQIIGITNFIITFFGVLAVLMLIIAAVMYASSAGNEEQMGKAKRILVATVVSMVLIYGAFALVSTIITGDLSNI